MKRQFLAMALILLGLSSPAPAWADCVGDYTREALLNDLSAGTESLRVADEAAFQAAGLRLEEGLLCIGEELPTVVFATAYRFIGAAHFIAGEEEASRRWFRTALELDPLFQWDLNELSNDHPLRLAFEDARFVAQVLPEPVEGMVLVPPEGQRFMLDGRPWTEAEATFDRPHLLQLIDDDGAVVEAHLIDSNDFPSDYLMSEKDFAKLQASEDAADEKKGKGKKGAAQTSLGLAPTGGTEEEYAAVEVKRVRPVMKTPLLALGGASMGTAAVLYGLSASTRGRFTQAETSDEVELWAAKTNQYVQLAGVAFVVGLGTGYVGVVLDGSPGFVITRRF